MKHVLLVSFGGAVGSSLRYLLSLSIHKFFKHPFPYGTLAVNLIGCLLMGFLFTLLLEKNEAIASQIRSLLLVGLLGGFTTFSSFSIETLTLIDEGAIFKAVLNLISNCLGCLLLTWLGVLIGKQLL